MTEQEKRDFAELCQKLRKLNRAEYEQVIMSAGFDVDEDLEGQLVIYTNKY